MPEPVQARRTLIVIEGQEGAGKSTLIRALLPHTRPGARIDGEDLGQVQPDVMDAAFFEMLANGVLALALNYWEAGYRNVIAGSFLEAPEDYRRFRARLPADVRVCLVHLQAEKAVRDERRIARAKPSSAGWRDRVDRVSPDWGDMSEAVGGDRYVRVDNSRMTVEETVAAIMRAIPEVYPTS
ncbi:MAG TPA: hypothetical protein VHN99_06040 [Deinococcales bacterium]|nr:hypothetical protein [Deinococcales bacterium]